MDMTDSAPESAITMTTVPRVSATLRLTDGHTVDVESGAGQAVTRVTITPPDGDQLADEPIVLDLTRQDGELLRAAIAQAMDASTRAYYDAEDRRIAAKRASTEKVS